MRKLILSVLSFAVMLPAAAQKLEVRNITVSMTEAETDRAAAAAGMRKLPDHVYADSKANTGPIGNDMGGGGKGLLLRISFVNGKSNRIIVQESGDQDGQVLKDLQKKWGQPNPGFKNPFHVNTYWWGDPKGIWADFQSQNSYFGGSSVTIHAPDVTAPARQGVRM